MDSFVNPSNSCASQLDGRPRTSPHCEEVVNAALIACGRLLRGRSGRPMMLLGGHGTGKTALLDEIGRQAAARNFLVAKITAPKNDALASRLVLEMREILLALSKSKDAGAIAQQGLGILQRFASIYKMDAAGAAVAPPDIPKAPDAISATEGVADSGKLELDLPDLFAAVGEAAKAAGKGWLLLIDEVQSLNRKDLSALLASLHNINQLELPVMFVGAALPSATRLIGDAKPYAERLFRFCDLGTEPSADVSDAGAKPS